MPYFRLKNAHQSEFVSERVRTFRSFAVFRARPPTQHQRSIAVPSARQHRSKAPFRSGQTNQQGTFHSHDEGFFRPDLRLRSGHAQHRLQRQHGCRFSAEKI